MEVLITVHDKCILYVSYLENYSLFQDVQRHVGGVNVQNFVQQVVQSEIASLVTVPVSGDVTLKTVKTKFAIKIRPFVQTVVKKCVPEPIVTNVSQCV